MPAHCITYCGGQNDAHRERAAELHPKPPDIPSNQSIVISRVTVP
jgi:hypothetical protein